MKSYYKKFDDAKKEYIMMINVIIMIGLFIYFDFFYINS
jgi:hypothetical protein